ncbi:MAG: hypothetical protein ABSB88_23720 [Bryobacteraceae bacterium]
MPEEAAGIAISDADAAHPYCAGASVGWRRRFNRGNFKHKLGIAECVRHIVTAECL